MQNVNQIQLEYTSALDFDAEVTLIADHIAIIKIKRIQNFRHNKPIMTSHFIEAELCDRKSVDYPCFSIQAYSKLQEQETGSDKVPYEMLSTLTNNFEDIDKVKICMEIRRQCTLVLEIDIF